ncbi:MAG: Hint domain-containing protein [Pseudomonadota bacterium]
MSLLIHVVDFVNGLGAANVSLDDITPAAVDGVVQVDITGEDLGEFKRIKIDDFDKVGDAVDVRVDLATFSGDFTIDLKDERDVDCLTLFGGDDMVVNNNGSRTVTFTDAEGETRVVTIKSTDAKVALGGDNGLQIGPGVGQDEIAGGGGDDTISGGAGDDTIEGGEGADSIVAGVEDDALGGSGERANDFPLIRLGNRDDIDPDEWNGVSENAADLLGTYGDADNPLSGGIVFAYSNDLDENDRIDDNDGGRAAETYEINGEEVALDSVQAYYATVEFADGTSGDFTAVVVQMENGDVYLAPEPFRNADSALLESGEIQSITLNTLEVDDSDLYGLRLDAAYQIGDDDYVDAGEGDDTVSGGAGADEILGGTGGDSVLGGAGADALFGGSGDDVLEGGSGEDYLKVGSGADVAYGGVGDDTIQNASGDDQLFGGSGDDDLIANVGNDSLFGGAGRDTLTGGSGDDSLVGDSGRDEIFGGSGDDVIEGGAEIVADRVAFKWSDIPDPDDGGAIDDGDVFATASQSVGGVTVDFAYIGDGNNDGFNTRVQAVDGIDAGGAAADTGSAYSFGGQQGQTSVAKLNFSAAVADVSFRVNDLDDNADQTEQISIFAFDENGDPIPVTISTGANLTQSDLDGVTGNETATGTTSQDASDLSGSILVSIPGPVSEIQVQYVDLDPSNAGGLVYLTDVYFDDPFSADDTLTGGAGADTITGGEGADLIFGGSGDDTLIGGSGDDSIVGGLGDDSIVVGTGGDTAFGGAGADTIRNASGDDSLVGGSGDDSIVATAGGDTLEGGSGADTLIGGSGDDSLVGGSGNDLIDGGSGDDRAFGGSGDDVFVLRDGFGADTIVGGEGGSDFDTLDFTSLTGPVTVSFTGDEAGTATDGVHTITFSEIERIILTSGADSVNADADNVGVTIEAGSGDDTIFGGDGADTVFGGAGADSLDGESGDDFIDGGAGADNLSGDQGNDSIVGGAGDDTVAGNSGNDTLRGEDGNDTLFANSGNDSLFGGSGNDSLNAGSGSDTLFGGSGDDQLDIDETDGASTLFGGDGRDTLDVDGTSGFDITFSTDDAGTLTSGGTAASTFSGLEDIEGSAGSDTVDASAKTTGFLFDDESGADSIIGGAGDDTLLVESGDDVVFAGGGADSVFGGSGADSLEGGVGADTLIGGSGDDTFIGGSGDDSLEGGSGSDFFFLTDNGGADTIDGGADAVEDDLRGELLSSGFDLTATGDRAGVVVVGVDTVTFSRIDDIDGSDFDDTIDLTLSGVGMEADGRAGADAITGGSGSDTISGNSGDDTLDGGAGNDSLTGGDGFDTFVLSSGDDTIADFGNATGAVLNDGDQTNNDFIDLAPYYDNISELRADFADDGVLNQSNATDAKGRSTDYSDNTAMSGGTTFQGVASSDEFTQDNTDVICFATGTLILTPFGERPIEELCAGDAVTTMDRTAARLLWVGAQNVSAATLSEHQNLRPIRIAAGALGTKTPSKELIVSPQHRLLASGPVVRRMFGEVQILVPAKALVGLPGVEATDGATAVRYHHICCENHEVVIANGAPTETFYPGPQALVSLAPAARVSFLEAAKERELSHWSPARHLCTVRRGLALAKRSARNGKPLTTSDW